MKKPALKIILATVFLIGGVPASVSADGGWEAFNDVSVIWQKSQGIDKIRFDGEGEYTPEAGCSKRPPEVVTVLRAQLYTENNADDLFRGRTTDGNVNSYRIPSNNAPQVILGWLETMLQEGNIVRVHSRLCGNAGFFYVSQIELVK